MFILLFTQVNSCYNASICFLLRINCSNIRSQLAFTIVSTSYSSVLSVVQISRCNECESLDASRPMSIGSYLTHREHAPHGCASGNYACDHTLNSLCKLHRLNMYKVQVNGFTFISDSKDSETVTVIGNGQNRTMYRADAIALYKEQASPDGSNIVVAHQVARVEFAGTNILRDK